MSKRCLLVIDVQKGFINAYTNHIPARVEALLSDFDFVFASRFQNVEGSPYRTFIHWDKMGKGAAQTELAFKPTPSVSVIDKFTYTFLPQELLACLQDEGLSEVYLCGLDTDACVMQTAVALFERGIRPVILCKACASAAGEERHQMALSFLQRLVGREQLVD